jgi:hypothetical protein
MTSGFSDREIERLAGCLSRLLPHVRRESIAITGGVAMELAMAGQYRPGLRSEIADLDLVVTSVEAVNPSVLTQFLLSHYHVVQLGVPKFMIQLVDRQSHIRVDIFPDLAGSVAEASEISLGEHRVHVLALQRVLEHKLLMVSSASRATPIDPKHVRDAVALADLLESGAPDIPPEALAPDVYGGDADLACRRCELSAHPDWPLAPKDRIFEMLGWDKQPNIKMEPTLRVSVR